MSLGPVMLDLSGITLQEDEREILKHPLAGGVILFARNFESPEQLASLVASIHALREPRLLVAVDHEGGRIQRFRNGFTRLPACRLIGRRYDQSQAEGLALAERTGWIMALELRAVDVDFSFAPVLDLDKGISRVIGDRSFHRDPEAVAALAKHYIQGMRKAGMSAVGKHFPGHGSVKEDSHLAVPVDYRRYEDIRMDDLLCFDRLIHCGLAAIMPAHVIYPAIDGKPAGFSPVWLKTILRRQLQFQGPVFSDDLGMAGAEVAGEFPARARAALDAGCDMVVVCNHREGAVGILENLEYTPDPAAQVRLMRMHGRNKITLRQLYEDHEWRNVSEEINALDVMPELGLGDDAV